jgi:uncharacterized protein YecT (DUF1311 family)
MMVGRVTEAVAAPDNERCGDLMTNSEQKECSEHQYRNAVAALEGAFARAMERASKADAQRAAGGNSPDKSWAASVTESQRAWAIYRDAECKGVVGSGGGSGRMVWVWGCLAEKTSQRAVELDVPFDQR